MKERKHISTFLGGFVTALALSACLTTALAASGTVSYNFANVALDGTQKITAGQDITAADGQKVPGSILYTDAAGGKTNYLPIRTISDLLDVEIGYDSATKTVLLGKQSSAAASDASGKGTVPQNAKMGDKTLILSRGGTLLPDDDPNSYGGDEKLFKDKNGLLRAEWMVGNEDAIHDTDRKLVQKHLVNGDYPKNSKGESYGTELLAEYVGYEPDLRHLAAYPPEDRSEGYYRYSDMAALPKNLPKDGLELPSIILLEQIRTVDKHRLTKYIGRLSKEHISGMNHALAISIGLISAVHQKLTLCLCGACADAFRGTGAFILRETLPRQAETGICVYCGQHAGVELEVISKRR